MKYPWTALSVTALTWNALPLGVALAPLALACSPSSEDGDGGDGDGDGDGTGGQLSTGGASGGSSPGSGGSMAAEEDDLDFWVNVVRLIFTSSQSVQALSPAIGEAPLDCEITESGACTVRVCPLTEPGPDDSEYRHAGQITASFDVEGETISGTMVPDERGRYTSASLEPGEFVLLGGETGTVTAQGGDIGAFNQDVVFPLVLINTLPAQSAGASEYVIEAPRSQDLVLTWDRGAPGVRYRVQRGAAIEDETSSYFLTCDFDSTPGSGTIPSQLLSRLPSGSELYTFTTQNYYQDVGDDRVLVRIATNTTVPAKDGPVEIQLTD